MMNDVKVVKINRPGIAVQLWLLVKNGWLLPEVRGSAETSLTEAIYKLCKPLLLISQACWPLTSHNLCDIVTNDTLGTSAHRLTMADLKSNGTKKERQETH